MLLTIQYINETAGMKLLRTVLFITSISASMCASRHQMIETALRCIKQILPEDYYFGADVYNDDFLWPIHKQWHAKTNQRYLKWPHHDGNIF